MRVPMMVADLGARLLTLISAEQAHNLTIKMLARGFCPTASLTNTPELQCRVAGLTFPNPLGLAAGFDKNARVPDAMLDLGFGFTEVGAVTPQPQAGNDKPRVFRLRDDMAVINRYGFNNDGLETIATRLSARKQNNKSGIVGINIGANKTSQDRIADYVTCIKGLAGLVDFFTVNISSPNTPGLRSMQGREILMELLAQVQEARDEGQHSTPIFLKVAPDLNDTDKADIADAVRAMGIDALIISNTTITRPDDLVSHHAKQTGGLSGAPLFELSTQTLREFYQVLGRDVPLIGVGGISSARDAYQKILAGATLIQLYTALIYQGPGLAQRIVRELPNFLQADGFQSITEAVGAENH